MGSPAQDERRGIDSATGQPRGGQIRGVQSEAGQAAATRCPEGLAADLRSSEEVSMKYVISWVAKPNMGEAEAVRSLQVFSKWAPSERVTFEQFLGRADAKGGFAVVTTDDV